MAAVENVRKINLKLVVDAEKYKVIFAETNGNFVNILFSFLTMPLGTIIRLLNKQQDSQEIGCFTTLYRGIAGLDNEYLVTGTCKHMLLHPRNAAELFCKKLMLNIDDSEPTRYFRSSCWPHSHLSTYKNRRCICGYKLAEEVSLKKFGRNGLVGNKGGVFLNAETVFIIRDDLQVFPASDKYAYELLKHVDDSDGKMLQTKRLKIGVEEVLIILKMSFLSDSPLTHAFLSDESLELPRDTLTVSSKSLEQLVSAGMTEKIKNEVEALPICREITVKLVYKKDDKKVLYAEAAEDFVNLLFSFLTYPLGAVEHLFAGHSTLSSVDNLYKSLKELDDDIFVGSENLKSMLLSPKLANKFRIRNPLLDIDELQVTPYLHTSKNQKKGGVHDIYLTLTKCEDGNYYTEECTIIEPKSPEGSTLSQGGYVKGRTRFMVSDDLKVTPLSSYETISFLQSMNIGNDDVEERVVSFGKSEALSVLKAALVSKSALTLGLNLNMEDVHKQKSSMNEDFAFEII